MGRLALNPTPVFLCPPRVLDDPPLRDPPAGAATPTATRLSTAAERGSRSASALSSDCALSLRGNPTSRVLSPLRWWEQGAPGRRARAVTRDGGLAPGLRGLQGGRSRGPPFPAGGKAVARPWARGGGGTGPHGGRATWQREGRRAPRGRTGQMTQPRSQRLRRKHSGRGPGPAAQGARPLPCGSRGPPRPPPREAPAGVAGGADAGGGVRGSATDGTRSHGSNPRPTDSKQQAAAAMGARTRGRTATQLTSTPTTVLPEGELTPPRQRACAQERRGRRWPRGV